MEKRLPFLIYCMCKLCVNLCSKLIYYQPVVQVVVRKSGSEERLAVLSVIVIK